MSEDQFKRRWFSDQFRAENQTRLDSLFVRKSLQGKIDLRGLVVGLDGALPSLVHADLTGALVEGVDLSHSAFSCPFRAVRANNCTFAQCLFDTCWFKGAKFDHCTFDSASLESPILDDSQFQACSFERTRIFGKGSKEYGGRRVIFERCIFRSALFQNLQLRACRFNDCIFQDTIFKKSILAGTKFEGGEPERSAFVNCGCQ